jgi:SAM-dependent methyltransferase
VDQANPFAGTELDAALERRRAYARIFDAPSRRFLSALAPAAGWRCLDVDGGAGAGELAGWLAEQGATVLALVPEAAPPPVPNVETRIGSLLTAQLVPASFDLVHGRAALIHAPQFVDGLAALLRALRPGGWLVLEEPDYSAARAFTGSFDQRQGFANVNRAREALFRAQRTDFGFGARLPGLLQARGLDALAIENDAPLVRGGAPHAALVAEAVASRADDYRATGLVSAGDLDGYLSFAADPSCWGIPHATIRAAGRKPAR